MRLLAADLQFDLNLKRQFTIRSHRPVITELVGSIRTVAKLKVTNIPWYNANNYLIPNQLRKFFIPIDLNQAAKE